MRRSLFFVLSLLFSFSASFGQDIYTYTNDVTGAPSYVDANIPTYSGLTPIGTTGTTACASGYSGMTGWPLAGAGGATYSSSGPCVQIMLTATSGYIIKATGFSAGLRRSAGSGPAAARLAYSTDGVTWIDDGSDYTPLSGGCATDATGVTVADWNPFCVSASTLYFRIYAYDAGGSTGLITGGTLQIYGLDIVGSVVPTPAVPTVSASGPTSFCPGSHVVLTTPYNASYTYQWYNGTTAIAGETTNAYAAYSAGDYYVDLTSSGLCSDTSLHTHVTVYPAPAPVVSPVGPVSFCTPGSTTLTETSGTGTTYQWYNGSGIIAGATNATYAANATGRDSVKVTNSSGCSTTSAAVVVTAITPPTAVVTPAGPLAFCPGGSATLTATTGAGYTYQWYNGAGAIAGATNSTLVVTTAGRDSVVISSGTCATTSNTVVITVNPAPVPVISLSGPATFCTPGSVTITETSGTGTSYQWYNGSGIIGGATNSSYSTTVSGRDSVVVTNSYGCSTTSAVTVVTANTTPTASVSPAGPVAICAGSTTVLTANAGAGYTYQWYNGSGAIPGATAISTTISTAGRDSVVVTSNGCSARSAAVVVTVNPVPDATTTASGPLNFCPGDSVVLTATAGSGYTFQWRTNTASIPGATNISYTVHGAGTYHVRVTNSFGCVSNGLSFTTSVYSSPTTGVSYSGPVSFCSGANLVITATDAGPGDTYQWYDASGPIAGQTSPSYTATATGDYYAVVTSVNGCPATTVSTHAVEIATPTIAPMGTPNFCSGGSVALTASTSGAGGVTYQWMKDGVNIPGATNATYIATSTGNYTCLVTISPTCFSTTNGISVVSHATPTPVVTSDGHLHLSTSTGYATYQWYVNTVTIPGATTYTTTATEIGSYRVLVTDTFSCPGLSDEYNIYTLGVDNVNAGPAAAIYPNPASGILHIEGPQQLRAIITSVEGKVIADRTNTTSIDISGLSNGVYIVMIYDASGTRILVEKLIKE